MSKPNWIDKAVGYLSPQAGAARARARLQMDLFRSYEGATTGRRTSGWVTGGSGANSALGAGLTNLRARSRDLVRNNPYATRGIEAIATNIVGTGIIPQFKGKNQRRVDELTGVWKEWAETTACDADGMNDIYGLQELIVRTTTESGECLIRRRRRKSSDGLPIPLQLQVLEPDFIDTTKEGELGNGNYAIQGVEFDTIGRRVAYWMYDAHPGERTMSFKSTYTSRRVPASEIIPVYKVKRPGQVRGAPWLAPVIIRLRDFDEYEDAQLVRQKIAACFTAFIQDIEMPADPKKTNGGEGEKLEPGAIERLPAGKTVTLANPPGVQGYSEYTNVVLHACAIGLGIPYEVMTGDYSNVNFSSGRMGWIEFHRNIQSWRWLLFIPRASVPIVKWFSEAAALEGYNTNDVTASWTAPRREMIDPTKEIPAIKEGIRSGIVTLSEAIREQGNDPKEHLKEFAEDMKMLDELNIKLDCDPRQGKESAAAAAAKPPAKGDDDEETEK